MVIPHCPHHCPLLKHIPFWLGVQAHRNMTKHTELRQRLFCILGEPFTAKLKVLSKMLLWSHSPALVMLNAQVQLQMVLWLAIPGIFHSDSNKKRQKEGQYWMTVNHLLNKTGRDIPVHATRDKIWNLHLWPESWNLLLTREPSIRIWPWLLKLLFSFCTTQSSVVSWLMKTCTGI